jgi:hypothetical protein
LIFIGRAERFHSIRGWPFSARFSWPAVWCGGENPRDTIHWRVLGDVSVKIKQFFGYSSEA